MRVVIAGAALALLTSSCIHSSVSAWPPPIEEWDVRTAVVSVELSPSVIHVGDDVLVDYTTSDERVLPVARAGVLLQPTLNSTKGDLIPLMPEVYEPGQAVPTYEDAKSAVDAVDYVVEYTGYRTNQHYYAMFKAPDVPGPVDLTFFAGSPDGNYSDNATSVITTDVLP